VRREADRSFLILFLFRPGPDARLDSGAGFSLVLVRFVDKANSGKLPPLHLYPPEVVPQAPLNDPIWCRLTRGRSKNLLHVAVSSPACSWIGQRILRVMIHSARSHVPSRYAVHLLTDTHMRVSFIVNPSVSLHPLCHILAPSSATFCDIVSHGRLQLRLLPANHEAAS
jgi:hypothetical protein